MSLSPTASPKRSQSPAAATLTIPSTMSPTLSARSLAPTAASAGGPSKNTVFLDIDLDKTVSRQRELTQAQFVKKALASRSISFDEDKGRAFVNVELRFKPRVFSDDRVDEPSAEPLRQEDFEAVAADLAMLYKAYPGECELVRLRRIAPAGHYTEELDSWMDALAINQGIYFKDILLQAGINEEDLKVKVEFMGASPPPGMFYFRLPMRSHRMQASDEAESVRLAVERIVARKCVTWCGRSGRCAFTKALAWEPRNANNTKMDEPYARLVDPNAADPFLKDMAELWHIFKAPAVVVVEAPVMKDAEPPLEEWAKQLARNRAACVKNVLVFYDVPANMIRSGTYGDRWMTVRPVNMGLHGFACTPTTPRDPEADDEAERVRIRDRLLKASTMHRVEDIPFVEDALSDASRHRFQEQWTRVYTLIADVEQNLKVLRQRRRRLETQSAFLDRNKALARIKVSNATKQTMLECGEWRIDRN